MGAGDNATSSFCFEPWNLRISGNEGSLPHWFVFPNKRWKWKFLSCHIWEPATWEKCSVKAPRFCSYKGRKKYFVSVIIKLIFLRAKQTRKRTRKCMRKCTSVKLKVLATYTFWISMPNWKYKMVLNRRLKRLKIENLDLGWSILHNFSPFNNTWW